MTARRFAVEWSEVARRDLERIVDYLAEDNPAAALRVLARIEKRAAALDILPERGRVVPELARLGVRLYRELQVPPHRLIYRDQGHGRRHLDADAQRWQLGGGAVAPVRRCQSVSTGELDHRQQRRDQTGFSSLQPRWPQLLRFHRLIIFSTGRHAAAARRRWGTASCRSGPEHPEARGSCGPRNRARLGDPAVWSKRPLADPAAPFGGNG